MGFKDDERNNKYHQMWGKFKLHCTGTSMTVLCEKSPNYIHDCTLAIARSQECV